MQLQNPQLSQTNNRGVQEGQMVKMLGTIEASTVTYNPSTQLLTFYITTIAPSLTYEIHTGVKEFVKGGDVFYMPNKPKMEPTRILIEGPHENRKIAVKLDISKLEEKEKVFNKHYPKQMPCVIVLRYRTTEFRKKENADNNIISNESNNDDKGDTEDVEEVVVEHTEHTAVDLAERPKRRVISQIVTTGGSAYVVENLYGAGHENATGVSEGTELMVGSTIVPHEGEEEEEGLCVICLMNSKDTAVMPCRHMCMCKDCGEQLLKHKPVCPVCRAPISTLLHMPSFTNGGSK
ncbi:unnamed protein product [Phytomonas sp. EM1]|nr:unnamed protein product [Phytomonas sp. EM1]|eukprot:CCW64944.1 unnamed protein product [Phytomonas sp. isolate EM1]